MARSPGEGPEKAAGLTAEGQQAGIGDGRLAQVQHLKHREVFRQEPQAGVSKLWGRDPLSLETDSSLRPALGDHPQPGAVVEGGRAWLCGPGPPPSTPQGQGCSRFSPETPGPRPGFKSSFCWCHGPD